jgi:ABC-type phosphate/phosphonate transport system substrate-binding protein
MMKRALLKFLAIAALSGVAACGTLGQVSPWEKGHLAKPEMGFEGDRLDTSFIEHTYSSKEASSGGAGVGGGGCGCN